MPLKLLFHLPEMTGKRVNAEWRGLEVVGLPLREQLNHVLQVEKSIVDRSRGEEVDVFPFADVRHCPVMRQRLSRVFTLDAWIPEVMGFIDDDDVGEFLNPTQPIREFAATQ